MLDHPDICFRIRFTPVGLDKSSRSHHVESSSMLIVSVRGVRIHGQNRFRIQFEAILTFGTRDSNSK